MAKGSEHKPTADTRALVAGRKAQGHRNEDIADFFNISTETLAKHYPHEIKNGRVIFMDEVHQALKKRIAEGSDRLITLCLTHVSNPNGWRSADKMLEVDALKENTAALERKRMIDERVAELLAERGAENG